MNRFETLSLALEYIEDDLCDADAEKAAEKVLAMNGGKIRSGNDEFEVSLKAGYVVIPESNIRYNELFDSFIIAGRPQSE